MNTGCILGVRTCKTCVMYSDGIRACKACVHARRACMKGLNANFTRVRAEGMRACKAYVRARIACKTCMKACVRPEMSSSNGS